MTAVSSPSRQRSALALATMLGLVAACGSTTSVQSSAGDAVVAFIAEDDVLSQGDFDEECVQSAAAGLPDDLAQDVVDDGGRIDFDVDERDQDDLYDFYNCADERDLARAIADDERGVDEDCLENAFDDNGIGDTMRELEAGDPARFGDFRSVADGPCGENASPETTVPDTTVVPTTVETTVPPTTATPTTTTTTTTTTSTTTTVPAPPPTNEPQPMPGTESTPALFASETEAFLNNDAAVEEAVGGDVNSVNCTPPSHTTVGANYLCFGQAAGFGPIEFVVEIDAVDSFLVTEFLPSIGGPQIIMFTFLVEGLTDEELQVDQVCTRGVVDAIPDADVQIIVDNINAPEFPETVTIDEDQLTNDLIACVAV